MAARAGSGGGGAENFPDLHHKMSKKIAQLTKVIYHLNTRNDDHEQEMAALAAQHEGEINGILRDAASKINKFKDALSKQREAAKEATTVRMLQERHEQEKADVLARFEDFKRTVKDRERATATEHAARLRELKRGFDDAKERFRERMQEFERTSRDLAANSSISSDELDRLKRNHQEEIEDLVRKYNKQYNDMLAQRMEEEDKMRAELEAENKAACENLSKQFESRLKKYKADSEAARAQLKAASDAAMLRAIDEHKVRGLPAAPKLQRAHSAPLFYRLPCLACSRTWTTQRGRELCTARSAGVSRMPTASWRPASRSLNAACGRRRRHWTPCVTRAARGNRSFAGCWPTRMTKLACWRANCP